jgi:hypothetical protein
VIDKKERRRFGVSKMSEDKKRTRKPPKRRRITSDNPAPTRPTKESLERLKEIAREKGWAVR